MKKLLLLLLLAPMIGKSQMLNLPVKKVHNFLGADLATYRSSNGKTVPEAKFGNMFLLVVKNKFY